MSKTKKTNKKSKNPFKRINFKSRKTQLITTVLVFAAVGGGILIKSFAASNQWVYAASNGTLYPSALSSRAYAGYVTDSAKNNIRVIELYSPAGLGAYAASANTSGSYFVSSMLYRNYQACALIRTNAGANSIASLRFTLQGNTYTINNFLVNGNYTSYCSGWLNAQPKNVGPILMSVDAVSGYQPIFISSITLVQQ